MQHEVMTGKQADRRMVPWTWAPCSNGTHDGQKWLWVSRRGVMSVTLPPPKDRTSFMPYCKHFCGYNGTASAACDSAVVAAATWGKTSRLQNPSVPCPVTSVCQSVDTLPVGGCQRFDAILWANGVKIWLSNVTWARFSSAVSKNSRLSHGFTHSAPRRAKSSSRSRSHIPGLLAGVGLLRVQVCSIWTMGAIIQRTAASCPAALRQIHYQGTNLKRSNTSSILSFLFPPMQYIRNVIIEI